jgi:hypothetical protein
MNVSWSSLRSLNGSQHSAFEELVCQLARQERAPEGSQFRRLGAPDGGVEAYWELPNGDLWGWQAKFFNATPGNSQWAQIDESVKTALEKRSALTRLTVCVPLDRQDPLIPEQAWFMDQWKLHVKKWKKWAGARVVEFEFWGQHEILHRLSTEENRGRYSFWFDEESFSMRWFRDRLQETISNAGPRYTPEVNVKLPIAQALEGVGRTDAFFLALNHLLAQARKQYRKSANRAAREAASDEYQSLKEAMNRLAATIRQVPRNVDPIDWGAIRAACRAAAEAARACLSRIKKAQEENRAQAQSQRAPNQRAGGYGHDPLSGTDTELYRLHRELEAISSWTEEPAAEAAHVGALLVEGDAGTGKTHLLCDVAERRLDAGIPTVVLLGQHFRTGEPWTQLISQLGLSCGRDEFLGAMSAAAEAYGGRGLIAIDALNESEGKAFWAGHLPAMLTVIARFPWLALVVSVRSSYVDLIVPDGLVPARLPRVVHAGFADHELQATRVFFDYYGIERPSVPLMTPEFQNPLFLKLFCKGLKDAGLTQVPKGLEGVTRIFGFFLDNLNTKLSRPDQLDFNPKQRLVHEAMKALARELAKRSADWLPNADADSLVNSFLPGRTYEHSLFRRLLTEGALAEDRYFVPGSGASYTYEEGVRFSYERLADHLKAAHLLDEHLNAADPAASFGSGTPLGQLVADEYTCEVNSGLVEAFSIQLPERIGMELGEVVPGCADFHSVREAFVESIVWRNPASVLRSTLKHARKHALRYEGTFNAFIDALLTVATSPDHRFNADFLHKVLVTCELPERDACWSIYLVERLGEYEPSPAERLIEWAWHAAGGVEVRADIARLAATTLCWFLTSSDRVLRDRATKALVALLTWRLGVVKELVERFHAVDDPYVSERVYAVAYGCAMRSTDNEGIRSLAQSVYDFAFADGDPPPHILLRDYARGVIEVALDRGMEINGTLEYVRPPYRSNWPETIPTETDIEELEKSVGHEAGAWDIFRSLGKHGDFARYVIGTNSGQFDWLPHRLHEPMRRSRKQRYEDFVAALTLRQKQVFDRWEMTRSLAKSPDEVLSALKEKGSEITPSRLREMVEAGRSAFVNMLGRKKRERFFEDVLPYLEKPRTRGEDWFDLSQIQRWITSRVFTLGWTFERFGQFDRSVGNPDRMSHASERIGKKYQWIAYYEILARVSDNFVYRGDSWSEDEVETYESPAQISDGRNIDPSVTEASTPADRWKSTRRVWWAPVGVDDWHSDSNDAEWLKTGDSIPDVRALLEVGAADNESWLALNGFYTWEESADEDDEDDEDSDGLQGREVNLWVLSYLIPREHLDRWREWGNGLDLSNQHLAEPLKMTHVFVGEVPWSPVYRCLHPDAASAVSQYGFNSRYPSEMYLTTQEYMWERGYDNSIEDTIGFDLPSAYLMQEIPLRWNGQGRYTTPDGRLTAMDPSVLSEGPSVLLLRREELRRLLARKRLALLWIVSGEKNAYGKGRSQHRRDQEFLGRTHIKGVYALTADGTVEGDTGITFHPAG